MQPAPRQSSPFKALIRSHVRRVAITAKARAKREAFVFLSPCRAPQRRTAPIIAVSQLQIPNLPPKFTQLSAFALLAAAKPRQLAELGHSPVENVSHSSTTALRDAAPGCRVGGHRCTDGGQFRETDGMRVPTAISRTGPGAVASDRASGPHLVGSRRSVYTWSGLLIRNRRTRTAGTRACPSCRRRRDTSGNPRCESSFQC